MDIHQKQLHFAIFIDKWGSQFYTVPFILKYLASYPLLRRKLNNLKPLKTSELNESQMEWVSLITQFDNLIESEFFKEYWVPLDKKSYSVFIDLSSPKLSLFETHYFPFEPYTWYKKDIIKDLPGFLAEIDKSDLIIKKHFDFLKKNKYADFYKLFRKREKGK